ncbi:MAG: hypothetical protein AAB539_00760 [Patescibacteria group bacterium]
MDQKICQNCERGFAIAPEDFVFYEKIKVPPPTFCPGCRLQRRLAFSNAFSLYKRTCDLCGKEVLSRYSPDKTYRVFCPQCWWSDKWDALEYGREYDFSRPFFTQFNELWHDVPLLGLSIDLQSAIESPYTNHVGHLKQCYLIFSADYNENCFYGYILAQCKDCSNSSFINACEFSHDLFHCYKDYRVISSQYTVSSHDCAFLWQCANCQNCFLSANLRNKKYYILNTPYSPEEYRRKMKEYDLGSYRAYTRLQEEGRAHRLKFPVKTFWQEFSRDVSGLFVFQSKNCKQCFEVIGAENCKYVSFILGPTVKDSYDYTSWGANAELMYECLVAGENAHNVKFGEETGINLYDADYTKLCIGGSNLFGCIGVRKKSYCILNKQYTKEAYEALVPKIIRQMNDVPYRDTRGREYRYGEFFPIELCPFSYNETIAQAYFPLSEKEINEEGYSWKPVERASHTVTLPARDLPDHIKDADDSLLRQIIGCARCNRAYRVIPQEIAFYKKMNVPIPRECFYCRIDAVLKEQPHPIRRWQRTCHCSGKNSDNGVYTNQTPHAHGSAHCPNEFETSYAPDRKEIVYCEACYNSEVA